MLMNIATLVRSLDEVGGLANVTQLGWLTIFISDLPLSL